MLALVVLASGAFDVRRRVADAVTLQEMEHVLRQDSARNRGYLRRLQAQTDTVSRDIITLLKDTHERVAVAPPEGWPVYFAAMRTDLASQHRALALDLDRLAREIPQLCPTTLPPKASSERERN